MTTNYSKVKKTPRKYNGWILYRFHPIIKLPRLHIQTQFVQIHKHMKIATYGSIRRTHPFLNKLATDMIFTMHLSLNSIYNTSNLVCRTKLHQHHMLRRMCIQCKMTLPWTASITNFMLQISTIYIKMYHSIIFHRFRMYNRLESHLIHMRL